MPMKPGETTFDSYAPLAWNFSITILTLEKLLQQTPIDDIKDTEREAFATVTEKVHSLSEASQIPIHDLFQGSAALSSSNLSDGVSTLVAIEERTVPHELPSFKQGWEDLSAILLHINGQRTGMLDRDQIERAQEVCLEILEHLNKR